MASPVFSQRLAKLSEPANRMSLQGMRRGIEKESLRVTADGKLAQTPHPLALGSALKHPHITTDFSEALLEFITPPCERISDAIGWLEAIHTFTYQVLSAQSEKLWVASMPCILQGDDAIPVARYGTSHSARMKTIYRIGLGNRYGRLMQTIAGIHYNVSFPDEVWQILQAADGNTNAMQAFKTQRYFDVIRNFRRHIGVLLYLFGASPAVCPTFVKGRTHNLQAFNVSNSSLYLPNATSLRMGDLGYQSNAQSNLHVCYNGLDSYIRTLKAGLTQSHPAYEAIGVKDAQGEYRQLNTHLLQIENEFYSSIRPKRVTNSGETPIAALHQRGVEYLEVRCMDLNPYLPVGIDETTAHFLEVFLVWCLLQDSPPSDEAECQRIARNQLRCVEQGRDPHLLLETDDKATTLHDWALSLHDDWSACATLLDNAHGSTRYAAALQLMQDRLHNPESTPSAQLLHTMGVQDLSFFRLAQQLSEQNADYFSRQTLPPAYAQAFADSAARSLQEQTAAEQTSLATTFEAYLEQYYRQYEFV